MSVRFTDNYVWNISDELGRGPICAVYKGYNRKNGKEVVIKMFNTPDNIVTQRTEELASLTNISHANIVKLLAIEAEHQSKWDVLIMEFCRGLNLEQILEEPQNWNGLEEKEFLLVFKQLTHALSCLYINKLVHRDIKPANIVKNIAPNGSVIYKLGNFGTTRDLQKNAVLKSICGTAQFLDPSRFVQLLCANAGDTPYDPRVDLWSLGITLYELATCLKPFRPYEANDEKAYLRIIKRKPSGTISAVQESRKGQIKWHNDLPDTCLLSAEMRKPLKEILQGLLDCDGTKIWSFFQFFEFVDRIFSHRVFHMFYVNPVHESNIYLPSKATLNDLKCKVEKQTNIPSSEQFFLWNGVEVLDLSSVNTTEETPIIVIHCEMKSINSNKTDESEILKSTTPAFTKTWLQDLSAVKMWTLNSYSIKRYVDKCVQRTVLIRLVKKNLMKYLQQLLRYMTNESLKEAQEIISMSVDVDMTEVDASKASATNDVKAGLKSLVIKWNEIENSTIELNNKFEKLRQLWNEIESEMKHFKLASLTANDYCDQLCDVFKWVQSSDLKILSLEKLKYESKYNELYVLLKTTINAKHEIEFKFEKWFSEAMDTVGMAQLINKTMDIHRQQLY